MNILFIIPARGGSKGIPRKNIRSLAGNPLISYTIKNALKLKNKGDVYVTSDDDEILNLAQKYGSNIHKRSAHLSDDQVTLDAVIYDAYQAAMRDQGKKYDLIVTLQPTSPLLKSNTLDSALKQAIDNPTINSIISAKEDTHLTWRKEDNQFLPNYTERLNRQYLTPNYKETGGFLICRKETISANSRIGSFVSLFELQGKESIDIDTFEDWNLCEYYLKKKKIIFVVSGHNSIGLGHIYNTLIVASQILDHEIIFFCDKQSELGHQKIIENNYPSIIQKTDNLQEEVLRLNPDVIINDRLDTKTSDINQFISNSIPLIHFEDLGEGAKEADLVFNAIYPEKKELPNHFFGPNYFCARDEFIISDIKTINQNIKSILIAYGGVDPNNLTLKTLEAIYEFCDCNKIKINVVTGFGYQNLNSLKRFPNLSIHQNVSNISKHMLDADLVFTSAGRTTYELAILGIPSIVLAQNKRELTHFFATEKYGFNNLGLGTKVGFDAILDSLKNCLDDKIRKNMQDKMLLHDLKNGKFRVVKIIKNFINNL